VLNFLPPAIAEEERVRRAQALFETHRQYQLQLYYPPESLYDTTEDPLVDSWMGPPLILKKLRDLLPFGQTIRPEFFNNFTTLTLPEIAAAGREQLLYWHLADATTVNNCPAESILLWNSDDAFWFLHVAPREEELIQSILDGN
jgi:hypothetical protein